MRQYATLNAIYKEDIPLILEKFGVKKDFENGLFYCIHCGVTMTYENLGIILPAKDGHLEFICNNPQCIEQSQVKQGKD